MLTEWNSFSSYFKWSQRNNYLVTFSLGTKKFYYPAFYKLYKISNVILNHATGFPIILWMILVPGCVINSSGDTQTSSAKFQVFLFFMCHRWNVFGSVTLITTSISNPNFLTPGGVSESVLRAVPGNRQASRYGKDMDSILKEFIGRVDVHDNTQISMLSVLPFKCIYHVEGSSYIIW